MLVKQFLKEALKPMFKGVLMKMVVTGCIVTFLDAISGIATGGGFGVSIFFSNSERHAVVRQ